MPPEPEALAWTQRLEVLVEIARILLDSPDDRAPEILLERVLEATGAERGFIVVREGEGFAQRFRVGFDPGELPREARRFSRSIVKTVLKSGEPLYAADVSDDPRFAGNQSVQWLGGISVLAAPLRDEARTYGVVYLEASLPLALLDESAQRFLREFTGLAALFLRRALEREQLTRRNRELERDLFAQHDFTGIVTGDPAMLKLLETVAQVAGSDATVLVRGESGTGKELVARALHANSPRRPAPFVTIHCSALPESVLESELFGHVKGAFTGASTDRAGRLAQAEAGTLFLDEIGELTPLVQAKLLRFLQFQEIQRLGSDRVERIDARVVTATHRDLALEVAQGRFREDLYYRLKVIELLVPPLRERVRDIAPLADHLARLAYRRDDGPPRFTAEALRALEAHDWPGNVRELQHAVQRCCVLARGPRLGTSLLPPELCRPEAPTRTSAELTKGGLKLARRRAVEEAEAGFLKRLLDEHQGNVSRAARAAGINRTHLQRLLARHAGRLDRADRR